MTPETNAAGWLETTWYGGNNNAESDVRGRVLAVNTSTAGFQHRVKVRRTEAGAVVGYWYDERAQTWHRFVTARIPEALWEKAVAEQLRRRDAEVREIVHAGGTP